MHEPESIGLDVTYSLFQRLASHLQSREDIDDEEQEAEALLPPVLDESIAQFRSGQARGFIFVQGVRSPKRFYYVTQTDTEQALRNVPPATLQDVRHSLQTYDPEREAVLISLSQDEVQQVDIGPGGTVRFTERRQRLPSPLKAPAATSSGKPMPRGSGPDRLEQSAVWRPSQLGDRARTPPARRPVQNPKPMTSATEPTPKEAATPSGATEPTTPQTESRPAPDKPQHQEMSAEALAQALLAYLDAETDAQARAILVERPELLTSPLVEAAWQQFWQVSPAVHPRVTARHKLWKRKRRQYVRKTREPLPAADPAQASTEIEWQPISKLPFIASLIDEMYADDQEQYKLYQEVCEKPHVLDDATVERALRLYNDRLDLLATSFVPQFERWQAEGLTDAQRQEVDRLLAVAADLRAVDERILALLKDIEKGTIDAVMRKSDFELGVEAMYGHVPLTDRQNQLARKIDEWVKGIERRGGDDEQILEGAYEYMATFKQLLDSTMGDQMDKLCVLYPGFYRFAMLLEALPGE